MLNARTYPFNAIEQCQELDFNDHLVEPLNGLQMLVFQPVDSLCDSALRARGERTATVRSCGLGKLAKPIENLVARLKRGVEVSHGVGLKQFADMALHLFVVTNVEQLRIVSG